jgi:hypothetical protein
MRNVLIFWTIIVLYAGLLIPFSKYMAERPVAVKVGYLPDARAVKLLVADQRYLFAQYAFAKVLIYYGTLVDKLKHKVIITPEYDNMFNVLRTVVVLDPYNLDAYYFAQAIFTWDVGRTREVNALLDYGMGYRRWDYQLPFFAGFNSAYFLKDYPAASRYIKVAAERSQNPLLINLAARYLYESGQSEIGIYFLDSMLKTTLNPKIKAMYELRINALKAVIEINKAVKQFVDKTGNLPATLKQVQSEGFLKEIPQDPYGGEFYLDRNGAVRSTSKFAMKDRGH